MKFVLQRGGLVRVLRGEAVWVLRVNVLQRRDGARVIDERVAGSVVTLERAPLLMHHCTCACMHTFLERERDVGADWLTDCHYLCALRDERGLAAKHARPPVCELLELQHSGGVEAVVTIATRQHKHRHA